MKKIISRIAMGIAWGFTVLVMILFVGIIVDQDFLKSVTQEEFIKHIIGSAVVGIGFVLPTIVYDNQNLSHVLKTIIHLSIGFAVYIPTAFFADWVNAGYGMSVIILSIICAILFAFIVYFCFYLFYRKEAVLINKKIKEKDESA